MSLNGNFICVIFLLLGLGGYSQTPADYWYFGLNAGVHFGTSGPVAVTNGQTVNIEGCATISDQSGNLLFYTDGVRVWSSNHTVMPNGTGLMGNSSSSNSAIIVPDPGNTNQYYLFTVPDYNVAPWGLRYSIVDLTLNSGLGDVVSSSKNTLVTDSTTERLIAVQHSNGQDYWILCTKSQSNIVHAFLLNASGVSSTPVNSISPWAFNWVGQGCMKASPNGRTVAIGKHSAYVQPPTRGVILFKFNTTTGALTNPLTISSQPITGDTLYGFYGVEFSPNSNLLYTSHNNIYQFSLSTWTQSAISNSVDTFATNYTFAWPGFALQLGPDDKIYNPFPTGSLSFSLGRFSNPNVQGAGAGYSNSAVNLSGKQGRYGLPGLPAGFSKPFSYSNTCQGSATVFEVTDSTAVDSVLWNFGDYSTGNLNYSNSFSPQHEFSDSGSFNVTLVSYSDSGNTTDTNSLQVYILPQPVVNLGPDDTICVGLEHELSAHQPFATYLWSTGSTDSAIVVTSDTVISVTVFGVCDTVSDTVNIHWYYPFVLNLGPDTNLCAYDDDTLLTGLPNALIFTWNTGGTQPNQWVNDTGYYSVTVTDGSCAYSDSIYYGYYPEVAVDLGNDSSFCFVPLATLTPTTSNALSFQWSTGASTPTLDVTQSGVYTLTVAGVGNHCIATDSVRWDLWFEPTLTLGADTSFCHYDTLTLTPIAQSSFPLDYRWNDNSALSTQHINQAGLYWVEVSDPHCTVRDSILVDRYPLLHVSLGEDLKVCEGDSVTLTATGSQVLAAATWNDLSTGMTMNVTAHGTYSITVTDGKCEASDAVNVFYFDYPNINLGADTALCPGDEITFNVSLPWQAVDYQWSNNGYTPIQTYPAADSAWYWVKVTNEVCTTTDSILISLRELPQASPSHDTAICVGDEIMLSIEPIIASQPAHFYEWNTGELGQQVMISDSGLYSVSVDDGYCLTEREIYVSLHPVLEKTTLNIPGEICEGELFELDIQNSLIRSYRWHDGSTSPEFIIDAPGLYWYAAVHECGTLTDTFRLERCECTLWLPNAFNPDGNGQNDGFVPVHDCDLDFYEFSVFDQWGERIFHSSDPHVPWDGTYQGLNVPAGVYAWRVSYKGRHRRSDVVVTDHGSVTVLR